MPDEVSVAVVVKDRRALMARCLQSLFAVEDVAARIIVVDNGSTDGTYDDLRTHAAAGRITLLRDGGSLGHIRNVALSAATTPIVAFTDSDCECDPGWLRELLAPFADPEVDVVQGRTVPATEADDPFPATQQIEAFSGRFEACNIAYRRAALVAAGGFDDRIGQFGEDAAAGWRVRDRGGKAMFASAAVVRHAVTYPGRRAAIRRAGRYGAWPVLVRAHPTIRRELMWHQLFLRPRSAAFDAAALAGVAALVARRPRPLLLAVPYLAMRRPRQRSVAAVVDALAAALTDAAAFAALLAGSVKARTVVL